MREVAARQLPALRPVGDNGIGLPVGGAESARQSDAQDSTQRGGTRNGFLAELGSGIDTAQRRLELKGAGQSVSPVEGQSPGLQIHGAAVVEGYSPSPGVRSKNRGARRAAENCRLCVSYRSRG